MRIYVAKLTFFRHFFQTLKSDGLPFLGQLRQERVIYLKRKPYNVPIERMFETGKISIMRSSTQDLVKVVLFSYGGVAILRMMPWPICLLILHALHQGFQMRYHLFLNSFGIVVKIAEHFLKTCCNISIAHHCNSQFEPYFS